MNVVQVGRVKRGLNVFTLPCAAMHGKVYQLLRTSLKTEGELNILNILAQAHSPAEAWLNVESRYIPQTIASAQSLFMQF